MGSRRRIRGGEHDRALLAELQVLWQETEALYGGHSCSSVTECCRFALTGREPYVTSIELLSVAKAVAARGGPLRDRRRAEPLDPRASRVDERTCPLLDEQARCAVYAHRPLGCRTYFCHRADRDQPIRQRQITALVRQVQDIAARHQPDGDRGRPLSKALRQLGLG